MREAAQRFGMPEGWIHAVIRAESAGRVRAVSRTGAMGLMQLMPGTWARQRARLGLGPDPFDPRDNILAGTSYLREMYDRYGAQGFLAAYNAGPRRYEQWRDRGRPLPAETRLYVARLVAVLQPAGLKPVSDGRWAGGTGAVLSQPPTSETSSGSGEPPPRPSNPFAREALATHDLFAPVTAARRE